MWGLVFMILRNKAAAYFLWPFFGPGGSEKEMTTGHFHFALQLEGEVADSMGRQIICSTVQFWPLMFENPLLLWKFPQVLKETIAHITASHSPHIEKTPWAQIGPILTNLVRHWMTTLTMSHALPALLHWILSQPNEETPESRGVWLSGSR